jgi:hypothetical protein
MPLQLNSMCRYHGIEQIAGIWIPLILSSSPAPQSSAISENFTTHTHHKNSPVDPRHLSAPASSENLQLLQSEFPVDPLLLSPQRAREILQLILAIRILLFIHGTTTPQRAR